MPITRWSKFQLLEDYIRDTTTNWFYNQFKIFPEHEMARESTLEEFTLAKFNKFNICFQIYWKKREPFKICGRGHKSCNKEQMTTFAQNVAETFSSATKQSAPWGIVLGDLNILILFPTFQFIPIYFLSLNSFSSVDSVSDDLGPEEKRGDNDEEGGEGGEENLTMIIVMILMFMRQMRKNYFWV